MCWLWILALAFSIRMLAQALLKYIDILVDSNSIKELQQIIKEICEVLKFGKFDLDKWASNSPSIIHFLKQKGILKTVSKLV